VTAQLGEGACSSPAPLLPDTQTAVLANDSTTPGHDAPLGAVRTVTDEPAAGSAAVRAPVRLPVASWEPRYRTAVVLTDLLVIAVAIVIGARFTGGGLAAMHLPGALAAATGIALVAALAATRAWDGRVLGQGAEEFRRLGRAVLGAGIIVGLAGLALQVPHVRPWVFGVLPAVLVVTAPLRYVLRRLLHSRRRHGRCMLPVLAAGSIEEIADLIYRTQREHHNGWRIEAVCTPGGVGVDGTGEISDVPVVGDLDDLAERVRQGGYRVVAVVPDPRWTRRRLQQLAWDLEGTPADVVVAPVLMEVTGPRLNVSPVFGLPLLRVSAPSFAGFRWAVKSAVDRVTAGLALILMAPLLLTVALCVWLEDRGPVLYRQTRVGKDGRAFSMIKFRSMVVDAHARRTELHEHNQAAGPLFKLHRDPRVTRVGAIIRRYSLDELPQLLNVLSGAMSLVGPRPPLPEEVARYGPDARRRLKVKPGLTGLWQISGRSNLSWTESVRLDLRYVENWSLAMDLTILWKTLGAVLRGEGAY
jgi:exopolysaccharide biosynthesis polyprenyl glycosylphosphotransferase